MMKYKAGERLQVMRELMGVTRVDFADMLGLDFFRLKNIEQKKCRMGEEEFAKIGAMFPEMLFWLTFEGDISLEELRNSPATLVRLIAAKIEAGQLPQGYDITDKIK
jgi:plasmid maintenance system antidote protein VapI